MVNIQYCEKAGNVILRLHLAYLKGRGYVKFMIWGFLPICKKLTRTLYQTLSYFIPFTGLFVTFNLAPVSKFYLCAINQIK